MQVLENKSDDLRVNFLESGQRRDIENDGAKHGVVKAKSTKYGGNEVIWVDWAPNVDKFVSQRFDLLKKLKYKGGSLC